MQTRTQRFWPLPGSKPVRQSERACDHPGCAGDGEFRAPKSRKALNEYYWFCLDHVREYNRAWDFCAGMSVEEIEKMVRSDVTWQRASWPLGRLTSSRFFGLDPERIKDHFGLFGDDFWAKKDRRPAAKASPEDDARRVMEIKGPMTLASLKARYKELCKRHHPDANGGDKAAEERFKEIGQAYRTLLASLSY